MHCTYGKKNNNGLLIYFRASQVVDRDSTRIDDFGGVIDSADDIIFRSVRNIPWVSV